MRRDHHQRAVTEPRKGPTDMKRAIRYFLHDSWAVGCWALILTATAELGLGSSITPSIQRILDTPVAGFSSHDALIPTLIQIAARYHVPMGIEKVTPQALNSQLEIRLERGTVRDLLNLCVRRASGYRWAVGEGGAINVYGEEERKQKSNLFNFVVPSLEVRGGTLNDVNARLRMSLPDTRTTRFRFSAAPPGEVFSTFGDTPGIGSLETERLDFEARDANVRSILNRIVALSKGRVIWISRVAPSMLSRSPNQGLWLLAPPSSGAIIPYLDPALKR